MTIQIETRAGRCGAICAALLAGLPEWFGIPASNEAYARDAENWEVWLAIGGAPVGLMLLKAHGLGALEIHLLAVERARRRAGIGRALVAAAEARAREEGRVFLTVKTRGPSIPYAPYEETRRFYEGVGFVGLEEFNEIWGPENPCLFMAKALGG